MKRRKGYKRMLSFVPEGKRKVSTLHIDLHGRWVEAMLRILSMLFGGAPVYDGI